MSIFNEKVADLATMRDRASLEFRANQAFFDEGSMDGAKVLEFSKRIRLRCSKLGERAKALGISSQEYVTYAGWVKLMTAWIAECASAGDNLVKDARSTEDQIAASRTMGNLSVWTDVLDLILPEVEDRQTA